MRPGLCAGAVGAALALTSCATSGTPPESTLHVYAAASLQAPFEELASEFEAEHSGVSVQLTFAGSSDLATQLVAGAPAEVFASADSLTMDRIVAEGLVVSGPLTFATNTLSIAVAPGNPHGIDSLESLSDAGLAVVLCAPQVPCGAAAGRVQRLTGVSIRPVSEEGSVTDVLGKVASGQADAGLVYLTDVEAAGTTVDGVEFDAAGQARNSYPIAVTGAGGPLAAGFVELVTGERGREVLADHGFAGPGE